MKYYTTILTFLIFCFSLAAQESRDLSPFDVVKVATGVKVTLVQGSNPQARVEVENCGSDEVITEVRGDKLIVKFTDQKGWNKHKNRKAHVTVTYQNLSGIGVSSGGMIKSENSIKSDDLTLDGSSGGQIDVAVSSSSANVDISSGSVIKLTGESKRLNVDVSSGGVFNGYEFKTSTAIADASSGGVAKIMVMDDLRADASSGGSVNYKGNPEKVDLDKSISGSIRARS